MQALIKDGEEAAKTNLGVSKLKMPALKMFVETAKKGGKYIVRFHVYDANEKPYEVQEAAANMIELLDSAVNEKDEKSKQMYDALKNTPGALVTIPSRRPGTPSRTVLNHRSLPIKSAIKANMPSITYGTEATAINSISLNTVSDNNINTHFLLETRKAEQKDPSDDSGAADSPPPEDAEAEKIFPVTLSLDMLGSPVIDFAQQIFIDIGTQTDLDNVYAAIDVQHNLKPGSFTTTAKMSPTFSGESVTFGDLVNDVIAKHDKVAVNAGVEEDESTDE